MAIFDSDILDLDIADLDMERGETTLMPDLRKCALLLDIDGTILDLAPSPQQVGALSLSLQGEEYRVRRIEPALFAPLDLPP